MLQAKATSTVLTPSRNRDPEDPFADPPEDPFQDPPGEDLFDHDPSVESSEDEPDRPDREGEELTDQEKIDLFIYTTSEYLRINRALRSGQPLSEEMQRRVDSISDALSKLPRMTGTIPGETEVLFDRNTSFEVVSSTTDPVTGKTLIKLKEVPAP